jgi:L-fuculose-phosphate aldolase
MRRACLVVACEGNLSVRLGPDRVLMTPTGVDKGELDPQDLVEVGLDGRAATGASPSTETPMHLEIYRRRTDAGAIAHAHPAYATAFAVAGRALDACILPEVVATLGCVPLSEYATPSTDEMSAVVGPLSERCDAFLLRNHGVVAIASDPAQAVHRLETVERLACITWLAEGLGGARRLTRVQVDAFLEVLRSYGSPRPLPPCRAEGEED